MRATLTTSFKILYVKKLLKSVSYHNSIFQKKKSYFLDLPYRFMKFASNSILIGKLWNKWKYNFSFIIVSILCFLIAVHKFTVCIKFIKINAINFDLQHFFFLPPSMMLLCSFSHDWLFRAAWKPNSDRKNIWTYMSFWMDWA